jgi:hypothetical protein
VRVLRGFVLPVAMIVIGVALIVQTLNVIGIIMGLLFIGAGAGRIWLERAS